MNQQQRLKNWMDERGYTRATLAQELEVSDTYIYKLVAGTKPMARSFRYRFVDRFGAAEANKIFDFHHPVVEAQLVPTP